jgi:hypothetical protein
MVVAPPEQAMKKYLGDPSAKGLLTLIWDLASQAAHTGLLATYYGDNGSTDITVGTSNVTLATVPGVVVTQPNQKLIIHATVYYSQTTGGEGTVFTGIFVSTGAGPLVPVDTTGDSLGASEQHTVTRVFELTMASPGTYTVTLQGVCQDGLSTAKVLGKPPGTGVTSSARVTVEVVNV